MEISKKKQIFNQVEKAYKSWLNYIDPNSKVDDIEQTIEMISRKLAFGTIIISGRNNYSSFIGTYRQCTDLKKVFGGQMGVVSNLWYWLGVANNDEIAKTVKNRQKNLIIRVAPYDIEEATLIVCEYASFGIRYGNSTSGRSSYLGNFKVCTLLRRKYGGKMGKLYNQWYWIGIASFEEIEMVYTDYQANAKRFKRKRIEIVC